MKNITKVGLSALAGSLALTAAHAGEMSVSGSMVATYNKRDTKESTGNPFGMKTNLTFSGSSELDNGMTASMFTTSSDKFAGQFSGKLVVSMRPLNAKDTIRSIQISSRFPAVHGAPIHLGNPDEIGIKDIMKPEFGDPPRVLEKNEIPVFWACGVTPQSILEKSKPDTLGQASRITGMTPAAITILRVHLRTRKAA